MFIQRLFPRPKSEAGVCIASAHEWPTFTGTRIKLRADSARASSYMGVSESHEMHEDQSAPPSDLLNSLSSCSLALSGVERETLRCTHLACGVMCVYAEERCTCRAYNSNDFAMPRAWTSYANCSGVRATGSNWLRRAPFLDAGRMAHLYLSPGFLKR